MPKSKIQLNKELIQLGEVLFLLYGDTSCHRQGLYSDIYDLVIMQNGKVGFMLIVTGDKHLVREL